MLKQSSQTGKNIFSEDVRRDEDQEEINMGKGNSEKDESFNEFALSQLYGAKEWSGTGKELANEGYHCSVVVVVVEMYLEAPFLATTTNTSEDGAQSDHSDHTQEEEVPFIA